MLNFLIKADKFVWGPIMIFFLLGSHIFLTYKTGFVQRYVFKGIKLSFSKSKNGKGNLSIFGSLMTALSSTVGTGNIIGVGTAIILGGPGSVFWTWIGGLFGIATKYAESFIAIKYREKKSDGSYIGGAMIVLKKLGKPFLAKAFAILCTIAAFGIGCATQSNSIAEIIHNTFDISKTAVAIVLCLLTAIVIFGGIKSIARVCERLVPIMAIVYIVGCVAMLIVNRAYLPETFKTIITCAFTPQAVTGGFVGVTLKEVMQNGISRGLFSNEAGMGSAPMASATAEVENAVKPALVGSTGVFWDTIVVCLMTGLVMVSSVIASGSISLQSIRSDSLLVSKCFDVIPFGTPLLVFAIMTFAYSTILGWAYYGETTVSWLFGDKAIKIYRLLWVIVVFLGATASLDAVWTFADIMNAFMCIPNIIAVLLLSNVIAKETKYYLHDKHLDDVDKELI